MTVPVLSMVVVWVSVVPLVPVATVVEVEDVCPYATKPMRAMAEAILRNNFIVNFLSYQVAAVIAAKGHPVRATRMNSPNQVGKSMRQFSNVTNKRCFATWFVALSSLFTSRKRINFIKDRGSHVALRILRDVGKAFTSPRDVDE